jgi:hypothetical protein
MTVDFHLASIIVALNPSVHPLITSISKGYYSELVSFVSIFLVPHQQQLACRMLKWNSLLIRIATTDAQELEKRLKSFDPKSRSLTKSFLVRQRVAEMKTRFELDAKEEQDRW